MGTPIDLSGCPSRKTADGEIEYFYLGMWVKSAKTIDLNDLTLQEEFDLKKIERPEGPKQHSSYEAMIEGSYKFLEVLEEEKKAGYDGPGRFLAKALWRKNTQGSFYDRKGEPAKVYVRINPLLNKDAKCSINQESRKKTLENYKRHFEGKIIYLEKIELIENKRFNSSSYGYTWRFLNE